MYDDKCIIWLAAQHVCMEVKECNTVTGFIQKFATILKDFWNNHGPAKECNFTDCTKMQIPSPL